MLLTYKYLLGAGIFAVGALIGFVVGRMTGKAQPDDTDECRDELLKAVIENRRIPVAEQAAVLRLVKADIAAGRRFSDPRLRDVFRIECIYSKKDRASYDMEILVYVQDEKSKSLKNLKIRMSVDWAYLPSNVRSRFIRDREERVVVLVYGLEEATDEQ